MRWMAGIAVLTLLSASCTDEATPEVATPTDTPTTTTTTTTAPPLLAIPWHEQVPFDPLAQDPAECFAFEDEGPRDPEDDDGADEPAGLSGENWMISDHVPALIDDVDIDRIAVDPATLTLHPSADFIPSHLVTNQTDVARTLRWLAGRWDVEFVAIPFAAHDQLTIDPIEGEQLGAMFGGWAVIGDDLISFTGCHSVYGLADALREAGLDEASKESDFVDGLRSIAESREMRLRSMGLGGNEFRFDQCAAPNPGVIARPGFNGPDMAFAWGDILDDYGSPRLNVDGWTIFSGNEHDPATNIRAAVPGNWPRTNWFVSYLATDPSPVAVGLFGVDPDLGLYASTSLSYDWEHICDIARDVLAFAEHLRGEELDRERWQLPVGAAGDEQIIVDTLLRLRDDEAARAAFLDYTPCTYKLCVLHGLVEPRLS